MERRAASHTEEEEMNQRRKLLNAAKKGDQKAIGKLFELYQVRIFSGEQVQKMNRAAGLHKLHHKHAPAGKVVGKVVGKAGKAMPASKPSVGKQPIHKASARTPPHAKKGKAVQIKKKSFHPTRKKK